MVARVVLGKPFWLGIAVKSDTNHKGLQPLPVHGSTETAPKVVMKVIVH